MSVPDTDKPALCQGKTAQLGMFFDLYGLGKFRRLAICREMVKILANKQVNNVTYFVNVSLAGFARQAMP